MTTEIGVIDFAKLGLLVENEEDISQSETEQTTNALFEALSTVGFVYLTNTGIPRDKIDDMNDVAERFFSLPAEEKMKYCTKSSAFGYDPVGSIRANPKREYDCQEGFRTTCPGDDVVWPKMPGFKEKVKELEDLCRGLVLRVQRALGIGMKLKDPEYLWKSHQLMNQVGNRSTMKLITYAPITKETPLLENQLRIAEHADIVSVTLLFQDDIGGLQVLLPDGQYLDVHPVPGAVLVKVGEILQLWSGGKLRAAVHRVVEPKNPEKGAKRRRSIAYFANMDDHVLLEDAEYQGAEEAPKIKKNAGPTTVGEYATRRFYEHFYR